MLATPTAGRASRSRALNGGAAARWRTGSRASQTRFLGEPERVDALRSGRGAIDAADGARGRPRHLRARRHRLGRRGAPRVEERASLSPDALTGWRRTCASPAPRRWRPRSSARLSAWQNWIFQRPNAVGERGALTLYGKPERPEFDWTTDLRRDHVDRRHRHEDPEQRRPRSRQAAAARARAVAAELPRSGGRRWGPSGFQDERRLPAHRDQRRRATAGRTSTT